MPKVHIGIHQFNQLMSKWITKAVCYTRRRETGVGETEREREKVRQAEGEREREGESEAKERRCRYSH